MLDQFIHSSCVPRRIVIAACVTFGNGFAGVAGPLAFDSVFGEWQVRPFERDPLIRRANRSVAQVPTSVVSPALLYSESFCSSAGIFSAALPRLTLRTISAADLVQMNGCGAALLCLM